MTIDPLSGPSVDPIGIVQYPDGFTAPPRQYSSSLRVISGLVLAVFAVVVIVSTGVSLGAYCLTSDGANTATLQPWLDGSSSR